MISFSLSFEAIVVLHHESREIIFYRKNEANSIDIALLEKLQLDIQNDEMSLPDTDYEIEISDFQSNSHFHSLILWKGKYSFVALILEQSPSQMTLDLLKNFGVRFESRFSSELETLYTSFQGNIDVFIQDLPTRQNLGKMAEEVFQIYLTQSYRLSLPQDPFPSLPSLQQEVAEFADEICKKNGHVYLKDIITHFVAENPLRKLQFQDIITEFITKKYLIRV
ncbi:MAG: hypothetical protein ACTSYI_07455 [Promethearchaeota archaeon]